MSRKLKASVVGLVAAAALVAAPAANAEPQKVCPSEEGGWFLTPPSPGDTVVDRNGDGFICVKAVNGRGSSRDVPGFSVRDDLIALI
jgi:hypothetical protein